MVIRSGSLAGNSSPDEGVMLVTVPSSFDLAIPRAMSDTVRGPKWCGRSRETGIGSVA